MLTTGETKLRAVGSMVPAMSLMESSPMNGLAHCNIDGSFVVAQPSNSERIKQHAAIDHVASEVFGVP